jgi:hypothetical protein
MSQPKEFSADLLKTLKKGSPAQAMDLLYSFAKLFGKSNLKLDKLHRAGNLKIPSTTAIFNMSSATDCPSRLLGICKAIVGEKNICYAKKSERGCRPNVLPFRRRQKAYWLEVSAEEFVVELLIINAFKKDKFDKLRLNEAGDFHSQACVDKAEQIARLLKKFGIVTYCYTSRDDLDYSKVRALVVNASGGKIEGVTNQFVMVPKGEKPPKGYGKCGMDCKKCNRCSVKGRKTWVPQH